MPAKKSDGLDGYLACTNLPSNCPSGSSRNEASAVRPEPMPSIALIIWQPLHTPSAKLSSRLKNSTNISASFGL